VSRLTEYVTSGFIVDGELRIRNQRGYRRALAAFRNGEVVLTIERRHATRSVYQNRYYWGCVLRLLSEHTGHTVDELHEWAKQTYNAKRLAFANATGEIVDEKTVGLSTSRLNKVTFGEFVESVRRFAAEELSLVIPDPDPDWRIHKGAR
jgi:hypothetical protein